MTVVMLSRYGRIGASSRLRMLQFEPYLRAAGLVSERRPFFDDAYLSQLYAGGPTRARTVAAFGRRFRQLMTARSAQLLWIEKEALPWSSWLIERAVLPGNIPVVADYDDAIFHQYDLHRSGFVRALLARKIDSVMASSALVTAGNAYLAARATAAGAPRVEIIPTVVDVEVYALARKPRHTTSPTIGWIGTPSTWREYMDPLRPMLTEVASGAAGSLLVVGAGKAALPHPLVNVQPWSEDTEVQCIQDMDIGIMPLTDTPWARGKCGYKLIQYMACGLPVVASPVGVNCEIVQHGVNGFLASSEREWREALTALLGDSELRRRMGAEGRRTVEDRFSLQVWGPRVASLLRHVAEQGTS